MSGIDSQCLLTLSSDERSKGWTLGRRHRYRRLCCHNGCYGRMGTLSSQPPLALFHHLALPILSLLTLSVRVLSVVILCAS